MPRSPPSRDGIKDSCLGPQHFHSRDDDASLGRLPLATSVWRHSQARWKHGRSYERAENGRHPAAKFQSAGLAGTISTPWSFAGAACQSWSCLTSPGSRNEPLIVPVWTPNWALSTLKQVTLSRRQRTSITVKDRTTQNGKFTTDHQHDYSGGRSTLEELQRLPPERRHAVRRQLRRHRGQDRHRPAHPPAE